MYRVEGYEFEEEEAYEKAKLEADGVRYIKERLHMDNPEAVFKLYDQMVREEMFSTPVGMGFLAELQDYLYTSPAIVKDEVRPITVHAPEPVLSERERKREVAQKRKNIDRRERAAAEKWKAEHKSPLLNRYRKKYHIALFFSIVLAVIVIGMFTITYISGRSVNILNYENALINKYEAWENDLNEREQALDKREAALDLETEAD